MIPCSPRLTLLKLLQSSYITAPLSLSFAPAPPVSPRSMPVDHFNVGCGLAVYKIGWRRELVPRSRNCHANVLPASEECNATKPRILRRWPICAWIHGRIARGPFRDRVDHGKKIGGAADRRAEPDTWNVSRRGSNSPRSRCHHLLAVPWRSRFAPSVRLRRLRKPQGRDRPLSGAGAHRRGRPRRFRLSRTR